MEIRRRRKGSKPSRRRGRAAGSQAGGAILSLVMLAGIVYFVSASSVGTWLASNVMAPVFTAVSGLIEGNGKPAEAALPSPSAGVSTEALDFSGGVAKAVTAEVSMPSMRCYMLQMGVYSSRENAALAADSLKAQGAAGYILEDVRDGAAVFRVMAAGYGDEASAKGVKERLFADGVDSAVYALSAPSAVFRVTAQDETLPAVKAGFAALSGAQAGIASAAIAFDAEAMTVEEGKSAAAAVLALLESEMAPIAGASAGGGAAGALSHISSAYSDSRDALSLLANGDYQSDVDFSSAMKYTHLYISHQYAILIAALAG